MNSGGYAMTITMTSEELKLTDYEIEMVLLENQIKDNELHKDSKFVSWLKKIFHIKEKED